MIIYAYIHTYIIKNMSIIWQKLCPDTQKHLLSYLMFFDLKNIEQVSKKCISKLQLKQTVQTFIDSHNLIDSIYSIKKPVKKTDYFLQIYYLKSKNVWDYINICSNKRVYTYKKATTGSCFNATYVYRKKNGFTKENSQESVIIYNIYADRCIIQSTNKV